MSKKCYVIAILEAKIDKTESLKQALQKIVHPSRSEKNCIEFHLHQDLTNPNIFILYEIWNNVEAHEDQFTKPYIIELVNQLDELLAKPYQLHCAHAIE